MADTTLQINGFHAFHAQSPLRICRSVEARSAVLLPQVNDAACRTSTAITDFSSFSVTRAG